jgi:hypothetical protein
MSILPIFSRAYRAGRLLVRAGLCVLACILFAVYPAAEAHASPVRIESPKYQEGLVFAQLCAQPEVRKYLAQSSVPARLKAATQKAEAPDADAVRLRDALAVLDSDEVKAAATVDAAEVTKLKEALKTAKDVDLPALRKRTVEALRKAAESAKPPVPSFPLDPQSRMVAREPDLAECRQNAPSAKCSDTLGRICKATSAEAGPNAPATVLGGAGWQSSVVQGLAQFLQERAEEEMVVWLEDQFITALCTRSYTLVSVSGAQTTLAGKELFPETCLHTTATGRHLGATFTAAIRADLEALPLVLSTRLLNVSSTVARAVADVLRGVRQGRPPLELLAELSANADLKTACKAPVPDKAACALVGIGIVISQTGDALKPANQLNLEMTEASPADPVPAVMRAINELCKRLAGCPVRTLEVDPTKPAHAEDRRQLEDVLRAVQALYALVDGWRQSSGASASDLLSRGGQAIERLVVVVDATVLLLDPKNEFRTAWPSFQPAVRAAAVVLRDQTAEGVRDALLVAANLAKDKNLDPRLVRYISLAADLGAARDAAGVRTALDSAAAPLGSWREKHRHGTITVTSFVGLAGGYERPVQGARSDLKAGLAAGGFAPVGIDFAHPYCGGWTAGLFISALDLGQLLTSPIDPKTGDAGDAEAKTAEAGGEFEIVQILSPGAYIHTSIGNSPVTLGAGVSLAPRLRTYVVNGTGEELKYSMLRVNAFLAVDLNLLPIYTEDDTD